MVKVTRITAPGIPNPAPEETVHEALPILHNDDPHYHELLELLRRDLALNPSTELNPLALAIAENLPWSVDIGSGSFVFAAVSNVNPTVKHRLGRVPVFGAAVPVLGVGQAQLVVSLFPAPTATQVSFYATTWNGANVTQTTPYVWMAIG